MGVQAQIQQPLSFVGEAPGGIIDLHGGHPQIREDEVESRTGLGEQIGDAREVHAPDDQHGFAESERSQSSFGAGQFQGIHVHAEEASARLEVRQDLLGMPPVPQSGIQTGLAGLGSQRLENLIDADRPMRSRRRVAAIHHLLRLSGVQLGIQLLVLFLEAVRVGTLVAHPPLPFRTFVRHASDSSDLSSNRFR